MTNCLEPDKIDELWPPEIATWSASQDLYVKAFSIESSKIDLRYVRRAAETLELVIEKLDWQCDADTF